MTIKDVGIVHDIDTTCFLADGSLYVNVMEENQKNNAIARSISAFSFENTISKIIADSSTMNDLKTEEYYSDEIKTFFKNNRGKKMDIIFFTEHGIKGIDKISIKDSSIIFLSLYGNIKLGFFINKTIANILFGDDN